LNVIKRFTALTDQANLIDYQAWYLSVRAYFSVQLITIFVAVKLKFAVEKGNVGTKKCMDSGGNDD